MIIMVLSRLMSLVSNLIYINFFGINTQIEIYSYATQLPNIIFNSFGTALVTVVIPVFAGFISTGEKERAFRFADNITGLSLVFTVALSILGIVAAPSILQLTRFKTEDYGFALMSLRIMFPIMIFYALNYILQGVLQSLGRFNMPAFVSVPGSIIVILYVLLLGNRYGVRGLIFATFIGLSLQALILIPPVLKTEYRPGLGFDYRDEDIKNAVKLIPPVLIGTSAYQLNMLFNTTFSANFKDAVALITTIQNLILYAVLAFIYSITSVLFPKLTMLAARNDMEAFRDTLLKTIKTICYFLIPAAFGFVAVRYQLIDFLYGWGKVTESNINLASKILALYAFGTVGIGVKEVIDRAFYSLKDTKLPALNGVIMMIINITASLLLVRFLGIPGIPLAYSVSALCGAVVLIFAVRKKIGPYGGKSLLISISKISLAGIIMIIAIIPVIRLSSGMNLGNTLPGKGIRLMVPVMAGCIVFYLATCLMKVEEAITISKGIKKALLARNG
jgi:putative peptidoglycan lipid II flippase